MTRLAVTPQDLATTRFALSPVADAVAALAMFARRRRPPWLADWVDRHRPAYREIVAEPVAGALAGVLRNTRWIPDFITPPPLAMDTTIEAELAMIAATPAERAHADLALGADGPVPAALDRPDVAEQVAAALREVWGRLLAPHWPRRRALLERDVVQRAGRLATYGWPSALDGMGPNIRWLPTGHSSTGEA